MVLWLFGLWLAFGIDDFPVEFATCRIKDDLDDKAPLADEVMFAKGRCQMPAVLYGFIVARKADRKEG